MNAYVLFVTYVWRTWDDIFFVVIVVVFTLRTYTYLVRVVTDDDCYTDEETRRRHCKPIGIMKEKMREVGSKARNKTRKLYWYSGSKAQKEQQNRTQGVRSNKVSRLCVKPEPGTLSHYVCPIFFLLPLLTVSSY